MPFPWLLPFALGPTTSVVPKKAAETLLLPAAPVKLRKIGMPLAIDEMPDTCHPFRRPRASGLFIDPVAPSGRSAFHDTFKVCVRSSRSTPYVRFGSYGSMLLYSPPRVPRLRPSV